jgi:hypothetical protein
MGAFRNVNAPLFTVPDAAKFSPHTSVADQSEKAIATVAAQTWVNGKDVFRITGGPIEVRSLVAVCVTANDTTASLVSWQADGTDGSAVAISGASLTIASAAAGAVVSALFTATSTATAIYASGVGISRAATTAAGMIVPAGIIEQVVATGSTTGTWRHYMRYRPLGPGIIVTALF